MQLVFTDYAQGGKITGRGRKFTRENICTISYLQMLARNNFLTVISINEVDNEFQSMTVLGK